jgi:hypothetical protein
VLGGTNDSTSHKDSLVGVGVGVVGGNERKPTNKS